jgi:peroxiredoxin
VETQLKQQGIQHWPVLVGGVLLGAAIGLVVFFGLPAGPAESPQVASGIEIGSPAPEFQLLNTDGEPVSLTSHRGSVVLLNFWATWCAPCRIEMPLLQETYETYQGQELVVLGIDFDEPAEQVAEFGTELGLSFPLLLDPGGEVQSLYRVRGYPTTVVLDRTGKISAYHIGILAESQLSDYLSQAGVAP